MCGRVLATERDLGLAVSAAAELARLIKFCRVLIAALLGRAEVSSAPEQVRHAAALTSCLASACSDTGRGHLMLDAS